MSTRRDLIHTVCALISVALASAAFANTPPAPPVIIEPAVDGTMVNGEDVHMECNPMSDPDPNQTHVCSDWEIWTVTPDERVWYAPCAEEQSAVHIHLGDGMMENSHAGRTSLMADTQFRLRCRHKDSSGDPNTQWSDWAYRAFVTGPPFAIFPLEMDDFEDSPTPTLKGTTGVPFVLPAGATPPEIRLESAMSELLLSFAGVDGVSNAITNPPMLMEHVDVRVSIHAGNPGVTLILPELDLTATDHMGRVVTLYLPAVVLQPGESTYFWVSTAGATYVADPMQMEPDFSTLARGTPLPWRTWPPGFRVEPFARGFQLPVSIAFVPNPGGDPNAPYFYVTELYGNIKVVRRNGAVSTYAANLLNFNPTGAFPGSGEVGLTGLVVDPNTGDVLASMLYSANPPNGTPLKPRVLRFHSTDGGQTAASQSTVVEFPGTTMSASHQISNLSFGPDGRLYIHMGDGLITGAVQDPNSLLGKVLRVNIDGTPPPDNPYYNAADGITNRDYIFAIGLRNPFGGGWRASDGMHYQVENGPAVDRMSRVMRGENYGYDGTNASMGIKAIYNWDPSVAPVNIVFVQPETFGGSGFPPSFWGKAFVTESGPTWSSGPQIKGKKITYFDIDPNGVLITGPRRLIEYVGVGKATAVALAAGPDGLYFSDFYKDLLYSSPIDPGASILRIRYVGKADFSADRTQLCTAPAAVRFTDLSDMPGTAAWEWEFGDGEMSDEQNPTHTYTQPGRYDVHLRITGINGQSSLHRGGYIVVGSQSGARAEYYDSPLFDGVPLTRIDPTIDFTWQSGSPDPSIAPDTFSSRWTGLLTPAFSETYTIQTVVDDGVRFWLDGNLLINRWANGSITNSVNVPLLAGHRYPFVLEHFENTGFANVRLRWQSPSQSLQSVPTSALRIAGTVWLPGDADCDGDVDLFDIDPFVLALHGEAAYLSQYPNCKWMNADTDADGDVDFFDIDPFVAKLGQTCQ